MPVWKQVRARAGCFYRTKIRRDVTILTLHRIGTDGGTSTSKLDALFEYVAAEHEVFTMSEVAQILRDGDKLPRNGLALTFDDGTKDHFTLAAPLLKRHGLRATFAVIGCTLFEQVVPPLYCYFHVLEYTTSPQVRFAFPPAFPEQTLALDAAGKRALAADDSPLRKLVQASEYPMAAEVATAFGEAVGVKAPIASDLFMTLDEVRSLNADGHEAAGHSLRHQDVGEPDFPTWVRDLHTDFAVMNDAFGTRAHPYIYPFGTERSPSVHAEVRKAGFCCAATTEWGANTRHTDPYALQRVGFDNNTPVPIPAIY
jgi:peptidoglycan/xylan/chitin deacetylase (PgdA/CDA1 family)